MATNSQSEDFRMRRLLRDSLMARPAPAARATLVAARPVRQVEPATVAHDLTHAPVLHAPVVHAPAGQAAVSHAHPENLEEEVAQSIKKIEQVVGNFGSMRENFTFYKDLVSELRTKLGEEKAQREELQRDAAAMERLVKSERERSTRAENLAQSSEAVIRDLEHKLTSLQGQTARLVKAITMLISAEAADPNEDMDGGLRLVS